MLLGFVERPFTQVTYKQYNKITQNISY